MAYTNPSIDDFKALFDRDFPYGEDINEDVRDADIQRAFDDVDLNLPVALFGSQASYTRGYLLLAAFFLVTNLQTSSQGIDGSYSWLEQSKSAGSVAASYAIPQRILDNPVLSMYAKNSYGAKYLLYILPKLTGQIFVVAGRTKP